MEWFRLHGRQKALEKLSAITNAPAWKTEFINDTIQMLQKRVDDIQKYNQVKNEPNS
jgi:hypothetical protein